MKKHHKKYCTAKKEKFWKCEKCNCKILDDDQHEADIEVHIVDCAQNQRDLEDDDDEPKMKKKNKKKDKDNL